MRYYVDGIVLKAVADYDSPSVSKKKNIVSINDYFDDKATIYFVRRNKIYKQRIFLNNDSNSITVKTTIVHSF